MRFRIYASSDEYDSSNTDYAEELKDFKFSKESSGSYIEINSLDELLNLVNKVGQIIFRDVDKIEIYDDYTDA